VQLDGDLFRAAVKISVRRQCCFVRREKLSVPVDRVGRVIVKTTSTIPGHPEVQVIGDLANFSASNWRALPGV